MNLTKNFTLEEMLRSGTGSRNGITEQFTPSKVVIENLTFLCKNILQPLRDRLGVPVLVSSGYRCARVNKLVGGVKTSQHQNGQAADLKATGKMSNAELFFEIQNSDLPFDQLLWEFGDSKSPDWVHVSYSDKHRRQVLYIK